eukprot:CAMPEP_0204839614 /NCGR_PEP_ID=MMETSP1346-20131115/34914_1 /ASSEMBLY_ACC=CAM_ASM_000771 /TAXON_ID=215587 /ORGANISM="Aplanochytrium stocchinoi, Strain GSBS06" /LENGTH=322 /DNA_ID=CAMNT_0051976485 /DNA_START=113 /DNA_END=1081 /DNA_ORIENTATION=-
MPSKRKLETLKKRFPIIRKNNHTEEETESSSGYPFGHLTSLGLSQLYEKGVQTRKRYENEMIDLKPEDVYAQSTNFNRTQQSCQSFLEGFLPHSYYSLSIHIYQAKDDFLNAWDSGNGLQEKVAHLQQFDKEFERQEGEHQEIRNSLCAHLPYFREYPGKFLWVYSGDYYVCNESHDHSLHDDLTLHRDRVLNLVAWRYLRWYNNDEIGKLAIGDFADNIRKIFDHTSKQDITECPPEILNKRFSIFSAHDVTLLPFMVALGAFKNHEAEVLEFDKVWPEYGTIISIEHLADDKDERFVRVLRNEEEIFPLTHIENFKFIWE